MTDIIEAAALNRLLKETAAQLTDNPPDAAARPLTETLADCLQIGQASDRLRTIHAAVLSRTETAGVPSLAEALLFTGIILAAEGFQQTHHGSLNVQAVGAIVASICKLPYVSRPDIAVPQPFSLEKELYSGVNGLLLNVLDREGIACFASSPGPAQARSYLMTRWSKGVLSVPLPADTLPADALCAAARVLAVFHQADRIRLTGV